MNLLILKAQQLTDSTTARISGRQLEHVMDVHQARVGDTLKVGILNGRIGTGRLVSITQHEAVLTVSLQRTPPPPLPISLVLALPRPKVLGRILQAAATLGIKQIVLINSFRVEKSYWQTPRLSPQRLEQELIYGLEQAGDTVLPDVTLAKRFKPFVEDQLPGLLVNREGLVAHPYDNHPCPVGNANQAERLIVIGPEGGFIPYEVNLLESAGCIPVSLGNRILKVEQALTYMVSRLSD